MVSISRKKIKGRIYKYLSKSVRLPGGRVTTIVKLLKPGENIKDVGALWKKYEDYFDPKEKELLVKWSVKTYEKSYVFSEEELRKAEVIKVSYRRLIKKLDKQRLKDVFDRFTVNFTYDSNAIEGNSLTLKDVSVIVFNNETVSGKSLREIFETRNSRQVVDMILAKKFSISHKDIVKMHNVLMRDIDTRKGYKKIPNIIYRTEREVKTTPPELVEKEMTKLIDWYNKSANIHPLERAAIFHGKFERIHPFEDGNGRVGRFLINVILVSNGYPPLIIRKTSRIAYMSSLSAFDSGYEDKFKRFLLQKFKETYRKFFEVYVKYA